MGVRVCGLWRGQVRFGRLCRLRVNDSHLAGISPTELPPIKGLHLAIGATKARKGPRITQVKSLLSSAGISPFLFFPPLLKGIML